MKNTLGMTQIKRNFNYRHLTAYFGYCNFVILQSRWLTINRVILGSGCGALGAEIRGSNPLIGKLYLLTTVLNKEGIFSLE